MESTITEFLQGVDLAKNGKYKDKVEKSGRILAQALLEKITDDYCTLVGVTVLNGGRLVGDVLTEIKTLPRGELEIEISKVTLEPGLKNFDLPSPLEDNILLMDGIVFTS